MTHLPKSELVGVLAPYSINARDIGKNWKDQGIIANSTNSLTYCGNGIVIIFDNSAAIYRSTDYGKTWTNLGATPTGFGCIQGCAYVGNGIVLAGDANGSILRSVDFGVSWVGIVVSAGNALDVVAYLGNGIALTGDNLGNIFRSTDYGVTWAGVAGNPVITLAVDDIKYIDNGVVIATDIAAVPSHIYRSTDSGATWITVATMAGINGSYGIVYLGNGTIIVPDHSGNVWRSVNFGASWINTGSAGGTNTFSRTTAYLGNGILLIDGVVAAVPGHVFRSTDFGLTWTDLGVIASTFIRAITYLDNGIVVLGDENGHVYRSDVSYKIDEAQVLLERPVTIVNADITVGQSHSTILVDSPGANRIVTLSAVASIQRGHEFVIKKIDATTSTITIDTADGALIDGAANQVLNIQYQNIIIRTDGTDWFIISSVTGTGPTGTGFILGQLKPNVTRYAMPGWNVTRGDVSATLTIGVIFYIPFYYSTTTTATEIAVDVTTASGGSTIDLRIFAWNDGVPGALFANLGTISSASTGVKTIAISVTFPQGLYFMAMRASATVAVRANNFSYPIAGPVGAMNNSNAGSPSDFCDQFITTVTAAYADPAPAPTAMQLGFPFFLLREN